MSKCVVRRGLAVRQLSFQPVSILRVCMLVPNMSRSHDHFSSTCGCWGQCMGMHRAGHAAQVG